MIYRVASAVWPLALFCGSTAALAQDTPVSLNPSSPWQIDYADRECRLLRSFGDGPSGALLSMTGSVPGESLRIVVAGGQIKSSNVRKTQVVLGPGPMPLEVSNPIGVDFEDFGTGVAAVVARDPRSPVPVGKVNWAAITRVEVKSALSPTLRLEVGEMSRPFSALRECIDDLAADWGIDLEAHWNKTESAQPIEFYDLLSARDFPKNVIGGSNELVAIFRLMIDEAGMPTKCIMKPSTNPRQFEDRICQVLLQKARFKPARDENGQPMKSHFNSAFRYQNTGQTAPMRKRVVSTILDQTTAPRPHPAV